MQLSWKGGSGAGVFQWILQNFLEHLFTEHLLGTASVFARVSRCLVIRMASNEKITKLMLYLPFSSSGIALENFTFYSNSTLWKLYKVS